MSKRETYETRTEELITPILDRMNFELVDVEYVKEGGTWYLRAYIDKEGGITVNDCEAVALQCHVFHDLPHFPGFVLLLLLQKYLIISHIYPGKSGSVSHTIR